MITDNRRTKILELLSQHNYLSVEKLARLIFVSEPTIRRDLSQLADEGSIKRTRGGASFVNPNLVDWPFSLRQKENINQKKHIAELAIKLVNDGDTLFLDSGSTCYCLARELLNLKNLSVLTYGVTNAELLANNETINSQITCGSYRIKRTSIFGFGTIDYINRFHAKLCFISSPGFQADKGIFNYDAQEAEVKKALFNNAEHTILLLDNKKFGKNYEYLELSLKDIDIIITDQPCDAHTQEICDKNNIHVIYNLDQMRKYIKNYNKI